MNRISISGLIVAITMGLATAARAENWYVTMVSKDHLLAVDRDTVRWREKSVFINTVMINSVPEPLGDSGSFVQLFETDVEINCDTNQFRNVNAVLKTITGTVLSRTENLTQWKTYEQGSAGGKMVELACRNKVPADDAHFDNFAAMRDQFFRFVSDKVANVKAN